MSRKKKDVVVSVLQKPSVTIAIRADLSTVQRKFYNALLYYARQELKKDSTKTTFTIPFFWLKGVLNRIEANKVDRNSKYYIEKLKELKKKDVEYNILDKEKGFKISGWMSLMSLLEVEEQIKTNEIRKVTFELPQRIRELLINPNSLYASIDLVVIKGLNSKYAIILYELAKDYVNVEIPIMTLEDFRKVFSIENKYKRIDHLRSRVLDPAVKELNNNDKVGFTVSYKLIKTNMKYTHVKFHVKPKPLPELNALELEVKDDADMHDLLTLIPSNYRRKSRVVEIVRDSLKKHGKDYTKSQIQYVVEKLNAGKVKDFVSFLKHAVDNDYASFDELDDIGFVTVDDAVGFRGDIEQDGKSYYVEIAYIKQDDTPPEALIGYDRERMYLVRLDDVNTGETVAWRRVSEERLLKFAKKNLKLKRERGEREQ